MNGKELVPVLLHNVPKFTGLMGGNFVFKIICRAQLNAPSQNMTVSFLSGSGVAGVAAAARKPTLLSPQPLPPTPLGNPKVLPGQPRDTISPVCL